MSDLLQPVESTAQVDFHVIKSGPAKGLHVKLLPVQPMLLNKVMTSVQVPRRPTYETRTISGKTQLLPMDEKASKETPGGEVLWTYYLEETESALSEQNNRVVNAILVMGTEFDVPSTGWQDIQIAMGISIPTDKNLLRAHYLLTMIVDPAELNEIISKIMRLTGVSEEVIAQAEGTFQRSIRDEPEGQQSMAIVGANQGQAATWELASQ